MQITLIRHGSTEGNALRRYIGTTDEPLSAAGIAEAEAFEAFPCDKVFVTPLLRTRQTARIIFPGAEQELIPGLREMDFGAFENRSADEMADDAEYRAWVDGMCLGRCPGGESKGEFCSRVCDAFERIVKRLAEEKCVDAVFVLHGGTIMAIMERFAVPQRDYYSYHLGNCGYYRCDADYNDGGGSFYLTVTEPQCEK
ncbi:MAG: histidine phosphatase family protein [Oscillospiraceae bacterium]|nr:histidine phosphatase family protein [Oscillospiraceae bacterium]